MVLSFGNALTKVREAKGMSQAELARQVGVTKQAINNIEHGISIPNVNTAMLIAIALGTTVDYLVGTEENRILKGV
ncbi:MAG: helix-turn-helix domain-containing protein [Ruminococcus sp.]|nr:helix-turn-helix domain-containing protein [Ruminococcus sp.]